MDFLSLILVLLLLNRWDIIIFRVIQFLNSSIQFVHKHKKKTKDELARTGQWYKNIQKIFMKPSPKIQINIAVFLCHWTHSYGITVFRDWIHLLNWCMWFIERIPYCWKARLFPIVTIIENTNILSFTIYLITVGNTESLSSYCLSLSFISTQNSSNNWTAKVSPCFEEDRTSLSWVKSSNTSPRRRRCPERNVRKDSAQRTVSRSSHKSHLNIYPFY